MKGRRCRHRRTSATGAPRDVDGANSENWYDVARLEQSKKGNKWRWIPSIGEQCVACWWPIINKEIVDKQTLNDDNEVVASLSLSQKVCTEYCSLYHGMYTVFFVLYSVHKNCVI